MIKVRQQSWTRQQAVCCHTRKTTQHNHTAGNYKSCDLDMLIPVQTCGAKSYRLIQTTGTGHTQAGTNSETGNWEVSGDGSGGVPTWQVAAQDLHPHADAGRRPPLREDSDVLRHDLLKAPHLRRVVVAVSFKNLRRGRSKERDQSECRGAVCPTGLFYIFFFFSTHFSHCCGS